MEEPAGLLPNLTAHNNGAMDGHPPSATSGTHVLWFPMNSVIIGQ